jgi:hypothetical protein
MTTVVSPISGTPLSYLEFDDPTCVWAHYDLRRANYVNETRCYQLRTLSPGGGYSKNSTAKNRYHKLADAVYGAFHPHCWFIPLR